MNLAMMVQKLASDVAELTRRVLAIGASGGGGGGEANTASNQGAGGVGLYHSKVGVDLQFKNINAGSTKITVTNDAPNKEVDIDVAQANLDHGSIGGLPDDDHLIYLLASGARALGGNWALGGFNLTAGGSIYSDYYILGANPAAAGRIRLPNNATIRARNAANLADITLIYADANDRILLGGGDVSVTVGGNVVIGASAPGSEKLEVRGRLALQETTDPAATANYGKIWVRSSDSKLYFMDDSGNIYELTAAGPITGILYTPVPKSGRYWRRLSSDGTNYASEGFTFSVIATAGASNDSDGFWTSQQTTAAAGNQTGIRSSIYTLTRPEFNSHLWVRIKTYTGIADMRLFIAMPRITVPRSDTLSSNDVGIRYSTVAGDVNWQLCTVDGAGVQNVVDTGVAVAVSTIYEMELWTDDGGVTWYAKINGSAPVSSIANVPTVTQNHGLMISLYAEAAAAKRILVGYAYLELDSRWTSG